jgi:hypothetical protein
MVTVGPLGRNSPLDEEVFSNGGSLSDNPDSLGLLFALVCASFWFLVGFLLGNQIWVQVDYTLA